MRAPCGYFGLTPAPEAPRYRVRMTGTVSEGWSEFAVATAGAAAALARLVMVAVSVNIREILVLPGDRKSTRLNSSHWE